jgi:hypothetical protein
MRNKPPAVSRPSRRNQGDRLAGSLPGSLIDEVYRQMFRLEAHRPGADRDLAVALLRAFAASSSAPGGRKEKQWLKNICPICLGMIDSALKTEDSGQLGLYH